MLRTRLWMGALLIALAAGVLGFDRDPWYPFFLALLVLLGTGAAWELQRLLLPLSGPPAWLGVGGVLAVLLANWPGNVWHFDAWQTVGATFAAVVLIAFVHEMAVFVAPGCAVVRLALAVWMVAYLGLLPSFLAQLRWTAAGEKALALAIFVPKSCDIGAYFTGRLLGRHKMSPALSPNKTWEGLAGGLVLSAGITVALNQLLTGGTLTDLGAVGFGLTVGGVGALGDLAESLVKRDCGRKDASQAMPGFGGVLDVIDSIVFAAPVAYAWLRA
jgi:phosphatidate cytidylyltransferase